LATAGFKEILAPLVQNSGKWWGVEDFLGVILKEEIVFYFLVYFFEKKKQHILNVISGGTLNSTVS